MMVSSFMIRILLKYCIAMYQEMEETGLVLIITEKHLVTAFQTWKVVQGNLEEG